jgi:hypothetical protein
MRSWKTWLLASVGLALGCEGERSARSAAASEIPERLRGYPTQPGTAAAAMHQRRMLRQVAVEQVRILRRPTELQTIPFVAPHLLA